MGSEKRGNCFHWGRREETGFVASTAPVTFCTATARGDLCLSRCHRDAFTNADLYALPKLEAKPRDMRGPPAQEVTDPAPRPRGPAMITDGDPLFRWGRRRLHGS